MTMLVTNKALSDWMRCARDIMRSDDTTYAPFPAS
jgi:hypothetical protein